MTDQVDGFAPGARPNCGFCNAPWTDDMLNVSATVGIYADETIRGVTVGIDVTCVSCGRLIYQRSVKKSDFNLEDIGWGA